VSFVDFVSHNFKALETRFTQILLLTDVAGFGTSANIRAMRLWVQPDEIEQELNASRCCNP